MKEILAIDNDFPQKLKQFPPIPKSIYYLGNKNLLNSSSKSVAVIGTRTPTKYGKENAHIFSEVLSKEGITIISGLARGIDTIAHKASLGVKGKTIAVVGSGLDVIYPPENADLYNQIAENDLIISQFKKGTKPLGNNFLKRNRIIAALADVVLVVEGKRRSGTLNTAGYAAEMGKDVYAIPGRIDSRLSDAPNWLISNGAGIASSPEDILSLLCS